MNEQIIYNGMELHYIIEITDILNHLTEGHELVYFKQFGEVKAYIRYGSLNYRIYTLGLTLGGVIDGFTYRFILE